MLGAEFHVQQPQEVVHFGQRPDRALAAAATGALLDGDGRRDAEDRVDVRPPRGLHELARVGVQRLQVATLPLGEDYVEGKRGFARARDAGEHGHAVTRDRHVHVTEIVLAGPVDDDRIACGVLDSAELLLPRHRQFGTTLAPHSSQLLLELGQRPSGMRVGALHDLLRRALRDDHAALLAALGTEIDDPVGRAHHVEVVLDDDQRIARVEQPAESSEQLRDIVEVQAGCRLVEKKQVPGACFPVSLPGQVASELQSLGLATGQRRHGLAEPQVAETDGCKRLEALEHLAITGEVSHRLRDRHVQHVRDAARRPGAAHHLHLQRLRAIPASVAVGTAQVHVREKLHLDVLEAIAGAGWTTAGAGIEAERADRVATLDRDGFGREALSDRVEGAHVARGIRAGGAPDRALVDHHDLGDVLRAEQGPVRARRLGWLAPGTQQRRIQHVPNQRGLAGPGHTRDTHEATERDRHVEILQVVLGGALHHESRFIAGGASALPRGDGGILAAREILRGQRVRSSGKLGRRALEDDASAVLARSRPEVDHAIGGQHDLRIVLDDQQRIAVVAQPHHHVDYAAHVAGVQSDGRLVQNEQRIHQRRAERRREVDSLDLAPRQGARLPVERQVAETHPHQEVEPRADLAEQQAGRLVERRGQHEPSEEIARTIDRQQHRIVHVESLRGLRRAEPPEQCLGLEPRTAAGLARRIAAVLRQQHADVHLVALRLEPREEPPHSVPDLAFPRPLAVDHPAALLLGELAPGRVERYRALARELHEIVLALAIGLRLPGPDRTTAQRARRIGHYEAVIDADHPAEPAAGLAGPQRRVERKKARGRIAIVDIAVGAVKVGRIAPSRADRGPSLGTIPFLPIPPHGDPAPPDPQGGLECLEHAARAGTPRPEAILHDLERAPLPRMDARIALLLEQLQHFPLVEIVRYHHGKSHDESRVARRSARLQVPEDAGGRIAPHRSSTAPAIQARRTRIEQFQVIVQLRHRADRGARGAHRVRLVDGDRGRNALDPIDLRLVHPVEELPRVRREGLDVAPLPLGVDGVENQRRLARA